MSSITKPKKFCKDDAIFFNAANPITGIVLYNNGVCVVKRKSLLQGKNNQLSSGREDKKIKMFTAKSMARLIATVNATDIEFKTMITLTYPQFFPINGEGVKKDCNRYLSFLRSKSDLEYLWFLEFQTRGAPHFHILTTLDCITPNLRIDTAQKWVNSIAKSDWLYEEVANYVIRSKCNRCEYEIIKSTLSKAFAFTLRRETIEFLRKQDGAKRYATKYAAKEYQKTPPQRYSGVGRFWGCSKGVMLKNGRNLELDETRLREFLNSQEHKTGEWDVLPKYIFNLKHI